MELRINNQIITEPIEHIIYELKREANWNVFKEIQDKGEYLRVTCPFHKNGEETHPSCSIFLSYNSDKILPGTFHCFTCGIKGQLYQLVAHVLQISEEEGKVWLTNHFGNLYYENDINFGTWDKPKQIESRYIDESILDNYKYYHPYLEKRKISFEVAKRFLVGYNKEHNSITFPVWDLQNHLVMITERSIDTKRFYIPVGIEKPLYLLNFILNDIKAGIKHPYVMITEAQIDALTAWTYGMPCIATCGSISDKQIEILKSCGINTFLTMFDNDAAGIKFTNTFISKIGKDKFVIPINITIANRKDINDLSYDEFKYLLKCHNILV